jgi:hypothetical protein
MKILKLTLKKQWFDMILSGDKTEEYRELKDYWVNRLTSKCTAGCGSEWREYKHFDAVQFFNGAYYSEKLPNFIVQCGEITKSKGNTEWGAIDGVKYFTIQLGEVLSKTNCI